MCTARRLFLIASLVFPLLCYGQADTVYYDAGGNETGFDNAEYYRVSKLEGNRYRVETYFMNNKLGMSGYFISLDDEHSKSLTEHSVRDGPFIYYDKKGNKTSEGIYENNQLTGDWKYYYKSTNDLWCIKHYKGGKIDGELTSYYNSGKLKRREQHQDTAVSGKCYDEQGNEIKFTPFEIMPKPTFIVNDFLAANTEYPLGARRQNIEGRIIVKFVVNEDGSISDVIATNHIGGGCAAAAEKVVSTMPKWEPGLIDDKKVKVYFTLPIVFKLTE